ncbi:TonB-dependent receptor [Luteimonas sp. RIT-PG2_3]
MRLKRSKLRDAITVALTVGVAAMATTGTSMAQDQTQATELDKITVTGSRIQSQTMTASSPVTEISAEEFQYSGATKVEDLVNQYPQLALNFDNFQNNPSQGYATVDLRELGPQRTLALVNGRRIPKGLGETPDISIIPAALVQRVDLLTGGASAVYGSDAMAGVVNFILDNQFEGVSVNLGYSAYQHDNDNGYLPSRMDARGFDYPSGNSGFDGISKSIDLAIGGRFGENGHAMGWVTWRKNESLLQGQRDYSSCALNAAGTSCGGSATADPGNFYIFSPSLGGFYALPNASGTWEQADPFIYNYAPINYYQRPDTRFTAGSNVEYEINEHFKPYLSTMFVNRKSSTQIAPSGAFFTDLSVPCSTSVYGSLCADLGIPADEDFTVYVAKRNVEGGPRIGRDDNTSYSITSGLAGAINDNWSYDASFTYNRSVTKNENINDFVTTRVRDALLGCPAGAFDGCLPYDVWNDNVSAEAAQALQGVGIVNYTTSMKVVNAYITGDLGFGLPSAEDPISLVAGYEWRAETYDRVADSNMATGNFTGLGGPTSNASGEIKVSEFFLEGAIPLLSDAGPLDHLGAEVGYRYSDYSNSGAVHTYKFGLGANFADNKFRVRAGYNRAIRAPNITELYDPNTISLWAGEDPCAGASPEYTQAQCLLTGVTAAQYGNIAANPAGQYNQIGGGNLALVPETADTWTLGFAANPIDNLNLSVDYYDIRIKDAIQPIEGPNILAGCAIGGNAALCDLIRRNAGTGDLFRGSDPNVSGLVYNTLSNYGNLKFRGIDLTADYAWNIGAGRLSTMFRGTYALEQTKEPIPGLDVTTYDCAGTINTSCNAAKWRHFANLRYSLDGYSVGLRWRYVGEKDYVNENGSQGSTDTILVGNGNKIAAYNYFDLSGSMQFGDYATWTVGVNNIADKEPPMVGGTVVLNGNSVGGYDQAGRYIFTSVSFKF